VRTCDSSFWSCRYFWLSGKDSIDLQHRGEAAGKEVKRGTGGQMVRRMAAEMWDGKQYLKKKDDRRRMGEEEVK